MQINVAQLLKEPVGAKRRYKIDEFAGENDENHVIGEVKLIRTNRGILVTGTIATDVYGQCSRCLKPAHLSITFYMEDEYFPFIDINTGLPLPVLPDEFIIGEDNVLDLDEALRQYIITATPTKILCKPDCRGICPICGIDMAIGNCEHKNRTYDHRWDRLIQLEKENKL